MIEHFTDPLLRAPTIASILMCVASSLIGVLVFLKKRSLLAETLSHATYPGLALSLLLSTFFFHDSLFFILACAFITSLAAYFSIHFLEKKAHMKEDSALCFVLATFFGIGVTLASYIQYVFPQKWQMVHVYLYGKVATMTDLFIAIYGILTLLVCGSIILFYKELMVFLFDRNFAFSIRLNIRKAEGIFLILSSLAVVIGMRSVGLILISAMLIAPAVFARACTDRLKTMFFLAGVIGALSAFLGNVLSFLLSTAYKVSVPTGPIIVLIASLSALGALLFAPKRGLVLRYVRIYRFQREILRENLLKMMWRSQKEGFTFSELAQNAGISKFSLYWALFCLIGQKAVETKGDKYILSPLGEALGAKIVRLHRLWEVYLVNYLGINAKRVHKNAEEIEHIITADLEHALIKLLDDPKHDPHNQPIPSSGERRNQRAYVS